MESSTDVLLDIRMIVKLYEKKLRPVCEHYRLTQIEADVISFLYNNPGRDTVGDIAELRMLSKGNVSIAAENLIQRSLLRREQDSADRRRMHLYLRTEADPIITEIQQVRGEFIQQVFDGFQPEDLQMFSHLNHRLVGNVRKALEGGECHE